VTHSPHPVLSRLDHSLLAPTVTRAELERGCQDALELGVAALCIVPYFVPFAAAALRGSGVRTCTVVGFPHGNISAEQKLREAELALGRGAHEIDVVVNLSQVLSDDWPEVETEIGALTMLTHQAGARLKWILETCYLGDARIERLCTIASEHRVDWVKTSTGFGSAGATVEHVGLLRRSCPLTVEVKASGGIRTLAEVERYLRLGASRIGTSRTTQIAAELAAAGR